MMNIEFVVDDVKEEFEQPLRTGWETVVFELRDEHELQAVDFCA
jgi:hypothetical protein